MCSSHLITSSLLLLLSSCSAHYPVAVLGDYHLPISFADPFPYVAFAHNPVAVVPAPVASPLAVAAPIAAAPAPLVAPTSVVASGAVVAPGSVVAPASMVAPAHAVAPAVAPAMAPAAVEPAPLAAHAVAPAVAPIVEPAVVSPVHAVTPAVAPAPAAISAPALALPYASYSYYHPRTEVYNKVRSYTKETGQLSGTAMNTGFPTLVDAPLQKKLFEAKKSKAMEKSRF